MTLSMVYQTMYEDLGLHKSYFFVASLHPWYGSSCSSNHFSGISTFVPPSCKRASAVGPNCLITTSSLATRRCNCTNLTTEKIPTHKYDSTAITKKTASLDTSKYPFPSAPEQFRLSTNL